MTEPYVPPPPPPYETSQQEFDSKIVQVLEASLSIPDSQPARAEHGDSWENYDEAAFEAAYEAAARQRESQGGSSSAAVTAHPSKSLSTEKWVSPTSPSVQPLQIHKTPSDAESKKQPSWLLEANLAEGSAFQPLMSPSTPYGENSSSRSEPPRRLAKHDEDRSQELPPFQSVELTDEPPLVMMAYRGDSSAPPSPLSSSPPLVHTPYPPRPASRQIPPLSLSPQPGRIGSPPSHGPHARQSLQPPARRVPQSMSPRPLSSYTPTVQTPSQPHMIFDHTVAYTKRHDDDAISPTDSRPANAAAFYNSAVSSHLSTVLSQPKPRAFQPHMRQSQHPTHQSVRGTALPINSATHSVPSLLPYALPPPAAQLPIRNNAQTHQHSGGTQARWATSEDQIGRDF